MCPRLESLNTGHCTTFFFANQALIYFCANPNKVDGAHPLRQIEFAIEILY